MNRRRTAPRRERGQALVETALSMMILLLLLAGMIDFGLAFGHKVVLINAARSGARYGTRYPLVEENIVCVTLQALSDTLVLTDVEGSCFLPSNSTLPAIPSPLPQGLTIDVAYIDANSDGDPDRGEELTVTIAYPYDPLFAGVLGVGPVGIGGASTMIIAGPDTLYQP